MSSKYSTIFISPPQAPKREDGKDACLVIISGSPLGKVFF
jgi:hypothetical protein